MPTMPPIQNADRYAKYTVTAATTNFAFPFPLFGKGDLKVVVDGTVLDPSAYSVTSASYGNWSLAPNPVTDTVVVLNSAVPDTSGATVSPAVVEIFGSIVPQRTIQATAPFSTFAFNYAFSYLTACLRELYAQFTRALQAPVGESALVLPAKATRSGQVLGFDSNGDPAAVGDYASISTGAATAVAAAASAAASAAAAQTFNPANYAPLASPTFTGDPKAPTPAAGDNDTSLATTAFVQTEKGRARASVILTADTTLTTDDFGKIFRLWADGITITLPAYTDVGILFLCCPLASLTSAVTIVSQDAMIRAGGNATSTTQVLRGGESMVLVGNLGVWTVVAHTRSPLNASDWSTGSSTYEAPISPAKLTAAVGVVQSVSAVYSASTALTAAIPSDSTIPQVTEGTQILSVTITPKLATSKLRVRFSGSCAVSAANRATAALFVNGAANAVDAVSMYLAGTGNGPLAMEYEFAPGSTTAQTITVRVGPESGNLYMNNAGNTSYYTLGGIMKSMLVVEEVK